MPPVTGGGFGETVADLILRIIADVTQYEEALKQADRALEKSVKIGERLTERYAQKTENVLKRVTRAMYVADVAVNNLTARLNKMGLVLAGVAVASFVPYTAALVKVSKENQRVELMFWKLNEAMNTFSNVLAEMILPHANKFAEVMQKIADRFQNLNPAIKKTVMGLTIFRAKILLGAAAINWLFAGIIKIIWVSAKWIAKLLILRFIFRTIFGLLNLKIITVLIAGFTFVIAKLGFWIGLLIGKLLLLPVILVRFVGAAIVGLTIKIIILTKAIIIGLVVALVSLVSTLWGLVVAAGPLGLLSAAFMVFLVTWIAGWGKIREHTKTVVEWLENTLNSFLSGFHDWVIGFQVQLYRLTQFMKIMKSRGIFADWKKGWEDASKDAEGFRVHLKNSTDAITVEFGDFLNNFEEQIEELKEKIKKGIEALFQEQKKPPEWVAGFELGLRKILKTYTDWGEFAKAKAIEIATSMNSAFSDFFFDAFMGELKTIQDYFASFGRFILRIIADIIAQLMTALIIKRMLGFFAPAPTGGIDVHEGGLIPIAHAGLAPGERMVRAQIGEGILSRNGMATLGSVENLGKLNAGESVGGGLTVNLNQIIRAWSPEDVYRERKVLAGAMIEELERNGLFRKAMNRFR